MQLNMSGWNRACIYNKISQTIKTLMMWWCRRNASTTGDVSKNTQVAINLWAQCSTQSMITIFSRSTQLTAEQRPKTNHPPHYQQRTRKLKKAKSAGAGRPRPRLPQHNVHPQYGGLPARTNEYSTEQTKSQHSSMITNLSILAWWNMNQEAI